MLALSGSCGSRTASSTLGTLTSVNAAVSTRGFEAAAKGDATVKRPNKVRYCIANVMLRHRSLSILKTRHTVVNLQMRGFIHFVPLAFAKLFHLVVVAQVTSRRSLNVKNNYQEFANSGFCGRNSTILVGRVRFESLATGEMSPYSKADWMCCARV